MKKIVKLLPVLFLIMVSNYTYCQSANSVKKDSLNNNLLKVEEEYLSKIEKIKQKAIIEFQNKVIESEDSFFARYNTVLACISIFLAVIFSISVFGGYKNISEMRKTLDKEKKIVDAYMKTVELMKEFQKEKNNLLEKFPERENLLDSKMKNFEELIKDKKNDIDIITKELLGESRTAFRELKFDTLTIIDNLVQDSMEKEPNLEELYQHYRLQIMEYQKILQLYNDDFAIVERALHSLLGNGTKKSIPHLTFLNKKLNFLNSQENSLDIETIRYIYGLSNRVLKKLESI